MASPPTSVLALALGGSSDVVGALAMARALGHRKIVLVQPGSPPRDHQGPSTVACEPVAAPPEPAVPPGGGFYDNATMLAYLMAIDPTVISGYYLRQPKDAGPGFSAQALAATAQELAKVARRHGCSAIVGVDFGGDVSLPDERSDEPGSGEPFISQRDLLNLRAATQAAAEVGLATTLVAVAPGCDASAVGPGYTERQSAPGAADVRVLAMSEAGELLPQAGPPPPSGLRQLPAALLAAPIAEESAAAFVRENGILATRIAAEAPSPAKRSEHSSKTYALVAAIARERASAGADAEFFVLGQFRGAEKARAHLHSAFALGVYDCSSFASC